MSRTTSTVLAVALHVLFFFFFVFSVHPFDMRSGQIVETFLTLAPHGNNQSDKNLVVPQPVVVAPPRLEAAPIIIPKPPPIVPEKPRDQTGAPGAPGDVLGAVGRALACSAGSWEHLSSAERARCGVYPWRAARLPNGNLVMVPANILPRLKEAPDTQFSVNTGADRVQSDLQKGITPGQPGGCPIMLNTPCLQHVSPGMRDATGQN